VMYGALPYVVIMLFAVLAIYFFPAIVMYIPKAGG